MIVGASLIEVKSPRRLKLLRIDLAMLVGFLSLDGSRLVRVEGMPADARIVGIEPSYWAAPGKVSLLIESETFPPVADDRLIRELDLSVYVAYGFRFPKE